MVIWELEGCLRLQLLPFGLLLRALFLFSPESCLRVVTHQSRSFKLTSHLDPWLSVLFPIPYPASSHFTTGQVSHLFVLKSREVSLLIGIAPPFWPQLHLIAKIGCLLFQSLHVVLGWTMSWGNASCSWHQTRSQYLWNSHLSMCRHSKTS